MNMMVSRRALLGGIALGGAGAMLPGSAFAWKADGAALYPSTYGFIKGFVDRRELAGTLAAIGKGQEALDVFGAGTQAMDSAKAVDADTLWRLYSMTKPVTGMAAMILVEDGKIKLDQPIADFLPAFAKMNVQNTPDGSITDVRPATSFWLARMLVTKSVVKYLRLPFPTVHFRPVAKWVSVFMPAGSVPSCIFSAGTCSMRIQV